jgi:hypothetical protein
MAPRCQWVNGDFGMSPFRGQLSGKPLPAGNYLSVGAVIKAQWYTESLICGGTADSAVPGAVRVSSMGSLVICCDFFDQLDDVPPELELVDAHEGFCERQSIGGSKKVVDVLWGVTINRSL